MLRGPWRAPPSLSLHARSVPTGRPRPRRSPHSPSGPRDRSDMRSPRGGAGEFRGPRRRPVSSIPGYRRKARRLGARNSRAGSARPDCQTVAESLTQKSGAPVRGRASRGLLAATGPNSGFRSGRSRRKIANPPKTDGPWGLLGQALRACLKPRTDSPAGSGRAGRPENQAHLLRYRPPTLRSLAQRFPSPGMIQASDVIPVSRTWILGHRDLEFLGLRTAAIRGRRRGS